MATPILSLQEIAEGVASQAALVNQALREFEARTSRVLSRALTTPPGSPAESDAYIIPAAATGVWSGKTNQIATFIGGAWSYYVPIEGCSSPWVNNEDKLVTFDGTNWVISGGASGGTVTSVALTTPAEFSVTGSPVTTAGTLAVAKATQTANTVWAGPTSGGVAVPAFRALVAADMPTQPYDVGGGYAGAPAASVVLIRYKFPRSVVFASGLAPSQGVANTAATAQTDFDIRKNNTSVGTMRFAAAGTAATFIMASQTTFAAGDILTIVSPATPDATLADIGFALAGTR